MSEPNIDNESDFTPDTDIPNQCWTKGRRQFINDNAIALLTDRDAKIGRQQHALQRADRIIRSLKADLARMRANSERWEYAKQCAVDEDGGYFLVCPQTAFADRDCDPDAEAFEAAVDAAIAAEKGAGNG